MSTITSAVFVGGLPGSVLDKGAEADTNGSLTVATGAAGGSNAGAAVLAAVRYGMVPLPPQTVGFTTAKAAAVTAIAAVAASPTQAEIQAALTAVLAAVTALTAP
jgi:hypothetical protein